MKNEIFHEDVYKYIINLQKAEIVMMVPNYGDAMYLIDLEINLLCGSVASDEKKYDMSRIDEKKSSENDSTSPDWVH